MLSELRLPEQIDAHRKGLSWISGELDLYGLAATLDDREFAPHVVVSLAYTYGERVYVSKRDGRPVYSWDGGGVTHSVADPAGAARRIATALRREQREQRERSTSGGRDTELYRIRRRELTALAVALDEAGHLSRLTTPDGMPVLVVPRPGSAALRIVATVSHGDVDWYRWADHGADIGPCRDVDTACDAVCRALDPLMAGRVLRSRDG